MTDLSHVDQEIEAVYQHTTGDALARFFTALRDERTILGRRCGACRRVVVPPDMHCDACGDALGEWTPVGPGGVVVGLTVVRHPMPLTGKGPPFAVLRVRLDGADTALVHVACDVTRVARGARVFPVWAAERRGTVHDIVGFDVEPPAEPPTNPPLWRRGGAIASRDPVSSVRAHLRLGYRAAVGDVETRFREGLLRGELSGNHCGACGCVYVPPRPYCPRCWTECEGEVRLPDTGTVTAFVIVNVPFSGQEVEIPYVLGHIKIDGADATFFHLVGVKDERGKLVAPPGGARTGMRVRAVWLPDSQRRGLLNDDIDHFAPIG
jgi:uncharacterized OB-fold protein